MSLKMSDFKEKIFRSLSIVKRITVWYTVFIVGLVFLLSSVLIYFFDDISLGFNKSELEEKVNKIATSKNIEKFRSYDDGIFFALFNEEGQIQKGELPVDENLPSLKNNDLQKVTIEGKDYFVFDKLVRGKGQENNNKYIRGVLPIEQSQNKLFLMVVLLGITTPVFILIVIFGGYRITRKALNPLNEIIETASEIEKEGDFSKRLQFRQGRDEINKMSLVFNSMLESLEASYKREKEFSSNAAHELRTPLAIISSESQYIIDHGENIDEAKESMKIIKRRTDTMSQLIDELMNLTKLEEGALVKESFDLSALVSDICGEKALYISSTNINIDFSYSVDHYIYTLLNKNMVISLIENLINNGIKFTKDTLKVRLEKYTKNGYIAKLAVEDNGNGISEDNINKIWDRFYQEEEARSKRSNEGFGLGLSIVKKVAELHHWDVDIKSEAGQGCTFIIRIR